jgi:hypothetical protein
VYETFRRRLGDGGGCEDDDDDRRRRCPYWPVAAVLLVLLFVNSTGPGISTCTRLECPFVDNRKQLGLGIMLVDRPREVLVVFVVGLYWLSLLLLLLL